MLFIGEGEGETGGTSGCTLTISSSSNLLFEFPISGCSGDESYVSEDREYIPSLLCKVACNRSAVESCK